MVARNKQTSFFSLSLRSDNLWRFQWMNLGSTLHLGSTFASAMARASHGSRNLLESLGGSPLPRVSSGTPLPRNLSGTSSADAWAGAWTKFLDSHPDALPAQSSWGSMTALNDLDKVVGLPPASASAQALAPADSVSEMHTAVPPPSPVPPVPPRAIASVNSTRNGAPRTSAGPPENTQAMKVTIPTATAHTARAMPQPMAVVKPLFKPSANKTVANMTAANRKVATKTAGTKTAGTKTVGTKTTGTKTVAEPSRKRKAEANEADEYAGLSKEEIKFRKKRTKIETPTYIPEVAIVAVPSGGLATSTVVETELRTGQVVKLTINSSDAAASRQTSQLAIKLDTPALMDSAAAQYRVNLRGGRIQWVSRKKLETILRNRRSAAATRNTVVDLRLEMDAMQEQLNKKNDQIATLKRMLEEAGIKHDVASSPRTSTAGTSSSSSSQGKIQTKVGLGMQQSNSGKSGARSPRTIAEKAKARLFRTLSGGVLQTRAAPWY
eukprot:COSAG02_NODE_3781_length_6236_cov_12.839661_5_plen_495_part_00